MHTMTYDEDTSEFHTQPEISALRVQSGIQSQKLLYTKIVFRRNRRASVVRLDLIEFATFRVTALRSRVGRCGRGSEDR